MAVPVKYSHTNFHKTLTQTLRYRYSLLNIELLETIFSSFLPLATVTENSVLNDGKCLGCNFPFRYPIKNHDFLTWMFFTPLWRTLINSMKKTNKRKWNKNLRMPSFWQYIFNCSNRSDRDKDKFNYQFPSIVKNNRKECLTLSKQIKKKR